MAVDLTTGSYDEEGIFSKHGDASRIDESNDNGNFCSLKNFRLLRIIKECSENKCLIVEGHFSGDDKPVIVVVEKMPFDARDVPKLLSPQSRLELKFRNNIYANYLVFPQNGFNGINVKVIYPACDEDFEKYVDQPLVMVQETIDFFRSTVEPYFENLSRKQNYNDMINNPNFKENIVYTDSDAETGFTLFEEKIENCSCSTKHIKAISVLKKKEVLCLRNLSEEGIPLLQNIQAKCLAELSKKHSISPSKFESYVLYPPSQFPFHVVFETVDKDSPIPVEKAHHIDTIITNLKLVPDYYQKVSLNYSLFENDALYKKYTCPDDGDMLT